MNMQFSNDGSTRSSRMPYMDLRPWTLSAGTGLKTVYAQFDTDGNTLTFELSSDHNILYDTGSVLTGCI
ncbi:TPA: hypothetical protein DCZ39_01640 [Patescibacteria group bacterium]|nr:hypothetical protein [Candidatus Gracilibacteria bacterium]